MVLGSFGIGTCPLPTRSGSGERLAHVNGQLAEVWPHFTPAEYNPKSLHYPNTRDLGFPP